MEAGRQVAGNKVTADTVVEPAAVNRAVEPAAVNRAVEPAAAASAGIVDSPAGYSGQLDIHPDLLDLTLLLPLASSPRR